jgi:hypothetical protein
MIKSFAHKGLEKFFLTGSKAGIRADHAKKLARQLAILNVASEPARDGYARLEIASLDRRHGRPLGCMDKWKLAPDISL